jgi:hypothetical protein
LANKNKGFTFAPALRDTERKREKKFIENIEIDSVKMSKKLDLQKFRKFF